MTSSKKAARKAEVVVVGGGTSGAIAAIASARNGADTLVVESSGFLGGTATFGFPFLGFLNGRGEQVVSGGEPGRPVRRRGFMNFPLPLTTRKFSNTSSSRWRRKRGFASCFIPRRREQLSGTGRW
jgi:phytoene dehydrogenase-like protein